MKEKLTLLMMTVMSSILLTSCDKNLKELKEQVDKFNMACPMSFGDIMTLNSAILNNKTVELKLTVNESITSISALNNHKEDAKEILSMSLTKETSMVLVDKIIDAGAKLRTIIVGGQSNMRAEFELTAKDLLRAKEKFSNMTEGQKLIASNVLGVKIKLPLMIDDITKLVGLSLTADALVYKCEINDSETGQDLDNTISLMKYMILSQMAHSMKGGIIGERNRQFYQALADCNQGIEYEYHELQTAQRASFRISTDEIRDVLNGKWDNQPSAKEWENFGNALEEMANDYEEDYVTEVDTVVAEDYTW